MYSNQSSRRRIYLSIQTSIFLSIYIYLFIYLSIHSSIYSMYFLTCKTVKMIFISESFDTNILFQSFEYKTTFVNSQHAHTNYKMSISLKIKF